MALCQTFQQVSRVIFLYSRVNTHLILPENSEKLTVSGSFFFHSPLRFALH